MKRAEPGGASLPPGSRQLLALLVLSGFAAIALEIAWFRKLHLVLGSESYSVALVLAAFMAGLGAGSGLFGRIADRTSPLVLYRRLELGIGLYAVASPWLLDAASIPYGALRSMFGEPGPALLASKFVLSFALLLPPTLLMGGTLPAAARALTGEFGARGRAFALAYGFNAAGAGLAALAAPFVMLPHLGLVRTTVFAGCCSLAVFALARGMKLAGPAPEAEGTSASPPPPSSRLRWLSLPFFLTGFVALAAETVWNRVFSFFFTSSVYTFSLILFVYLLTLAAGSLTYPWVRRRFPDAGAIFATCQSAIAVLLLISTVLLDRAPLLLIALLGSPDIGFETFFVGSAWTLVAYTAPITFLFGLSFPAGVAYATQAMPKLGRDIGRLLLINTVGTAVASIVVTFVLFDALGSRGTLLVLAALMAVSHVVVARTIGSSRHRVAAIVVLVLVAAIGSLTRWDLVNFHHQMAQNPRGALSVAAEGRLGELRDVIDVLEFRDGPAATVSAVRYDDRYNSLFINGKPDASEVLGDMRTQSLCGILPVLFHPRPPSEQRVVIVGLGAGVTTAAVEAAGVEDLSTIEISQGVADVARRHFSRANEDVLTRTPVIIDDGRDFLASDEDGFDVIISEPSNPWISGVSSLFTDEFFRLVSDRLRPGGVFSQWMYHYSVEPEAVYGVVATLSDRFSQVHGFLMPGGDLLFLASQEPMTPAWDEFANPTAEVRRMIGSLGFADPDEILRLYLWSPEIVRAVDSSYPPNRDDRPWLEFDAPKFLFSTVAKGNEARFVGRVTDGEVELPVRWPGEGGGRDALASLGLDPARMPDMLVATDWGIENHWTVGANGIAQSRAWFHVRFEGDAAGSFEYRSPLVRVPPTPEEVLELLRAELGGSGQGARATVHGHTAFVARSPSQPDRLLWFWYCPENRRNYMVDHVAPAGSDPAAAGGLVTCVHDRDR